MNDWGYGFNEPRCEREEAENNGKCKNCGEIALVDRPFTQRSPLLGK